jgi:hypothetical protein
MRIFHGSSNTFVFTAIVLLLYTYFSCLPNYTVYIFPLMPILLNMTTTGQSDWDAHLPSVPPLGKELSLPYGGASYEDFAIGHATFPRDFRPRT